MNSRCALATLSTKLRRPIYGFELVHPGASVEHQKFRCAGFAAANNFRAIMPDRSGARSRRFLVMMNSSLNKAFLTLALVMVAASIGFSQPPSTAGAVQADFNRAPQNGSAPRPGSTSPSQSTPKSSQAVAQPAYLTPIAGLQGVLAETVDGATVAARSVDQRFNPASSVKLATALVALQNLGPDHRFVTGLWTTGPVDKSSGTVKGDLVVTGQDPSLHYEHAVMLARQLNEIGIRTVTGNLIVAPGFTMNFDWSAKHSGDEF